MKFFSHGLQKLIHAWHHHAGQNLRIDQLSDRDLRDLGLNPDGFPPSQGCCASCC